MQSIDRARRRIKLRDLNILLTVAQRGSMAKAAAELAISQPAVSKAIADLERAIGLRLLDRSRNGVELTTCGRALVSRGVAIFDELTQGLHELEALADPTRGQLRIGSSESVAAGLLPAVFAQLAKQHPNIRLNVAQTVLGAAHYRELRERHIDLLLGWVPATFAEDDLVVETMFSDPRVVVAGRQNKWTKRKKLNLADLANEAWILPPPETYPGSAIADLFREAGLGLPCAPITTLSIHLCCSLAASGDFITVLPSSVMHFTGRAFALKRLPVELPQKSETSVAVVRLRGRTLSAAGERFIDCVRDVSKSLASKAVGTDVSSFRR
jgi:DNA-binding transcriptional LysR family regulator